MFFDSANDKWNGTTSINCTTTLPDDPFVIQSVYSSQLTVNSQMYQPGNWLKSEDYYYESIQIEEFANDTYSFSIRSTINMHGYLYEHHFNPLNPSKNLILKHYGYYGKSLFTVRTYLRSNITYILVITSSKLNGIGLFSVIITGRNKVTFSASKYDELMIRILLILS